MHGFAALLAVRLALGIGESVAYPSYSKILARDFSARHRGLGNGAIAAGQTSGPAIGTLFGGILMAQFGWRPFFIVLGCVSLLWLVPWLSWRPRNPAPVTVNPANETPSLLAVLVQRSAWGAAVGHFAGNYILYFLLTWLPFYLVRERNFSMGKMARIGCAAFLLCAASSAISGPLSDRWIARGASTTRVRKSLLVVGLGARTSSRSLRDRHSVWSIALLLRPAPSTASAIRIFSPPRRRWPARKPRVNGWAFRISSEILLELWRPRSPAYSSKKLAISSGLSPSPELFA